MNTNKGTSSFFMTEKSRCELMRFFKMKFHVFCAVKINHTIVIDVYSQNTYRSKTRK
jgi:hypothetical protein